MSKKKRGYQNANPIDELEEIMNEEVSTNVEEETSVVDTNTAPNNDYKDIASFKTGSFNTDKEAINVVDKEEEVIEPKVEVVTPIEEETKEPKVVKQNVNTIPVSDNNLVIENAKTSSNSYLKILNGTLNNYVTKLAPGISVDPKVGAGSQFGLYNTIFTVLNKPSYDEFKQGMLLILAYFDEHKDGCFSERYLFRFSEEWASSTDKLVSFHATLNMLKIISEPKERPISKFVDIEAVFNTGYSEVARSNIMRFIS